MPSETNQQFWDRYEVEHPPSVWAKATKGLLLLVKGIYYIFCTIVIVIVLGITLFSMAGGLAQSGDVPESEICYQDRGDCSRPGP